MTREQLCVALARHAGEVLSIDVARAILREACAEPDLAIDPARFPPVDACGGRYRLQCERLVDILPEHRPLQAAYLDEVRSADGIPPVYDETAAVLAERRGTRLQFTVRASSGQLVGILAIYLQADPATGVLTCTDDCIFLDLVHRRGGLAAALWKFGERCAFSVGVRSARFHLREANGAGRMARFMGYRPVATQFIKVCDASASALPGRHHHHTE